MSQREPYQIGGGIGHNRLGTQHWVLRDTREETCRAWARGSGFAGSARVVREVGVLLRGRRQVATFALDTEIRFAGAAARALVRR